jgi:hypothetical protein
VVRMEGEAPLFLGSGKTRVPIDSAGRTRDRHDR